MRRGKSTDISSLMPTPPWHKTPKVGAAGPDPFEACTVSNKKKIIKQAEDQE